MYSVESCWQNETDTSVIFALFSGHHSFCNTSLYAMNHEIL